MSEKTATELLASTARWTAAVRARESRREDRLFTDPRAATLASKEGEEERHAPSLTGTLTRVVDDTPPTMVIETHL